LQGSVATSRIDSITPTGAVLFRHEHRFPLDGVEKFAEGFLASAAAIAFTFASSKPRDAADS
jgi:hypothetical protein